MLNLSLKSPKNSEPGLIKRCINNIQLRGTQHMTILFPFHFQGEPLLDAFKKWRNWADEKVCCDYSLHMAITYWNDSVAEQMKTICSEEIGINSFKCFMAYKDMMMLRDHSHSTLFLPLLSQSLFINKLTNFIIQNAQASSPS